MSNKIRTSKKRGSINPENDSEELENEVIEIDKRTEKKEEKIEHETIDFKQSIDEIFNSNKSIKSEDFNWEDLGFSSKNKHVSEDESKNYFTDQKTISEKDIVIGTIVEITPRDAVININYKSEGIISLSELKYLDQIEKGIKIEVFVEQREDANGQLVLSHRKARTIRAWEKINKVHESQEVVKGHVKSRTKGGLIVDLWGIDTFLPGSQIDVKPIKDYEVYVDKIMEFKVIKINKEFNNVVVSHKVLIEEVIENQRQEIISNLEKGQVLEGTVKNITDYGVFMDLGGVDGLLHITDLSWGRVKHPTEILKIDQKINVVVLDFDYIDGKRKIALGLKQLQPHPWNGVENKIKVGDIVKGTIVVVADYGIFIEIEPGVEGLVHVSELDWSTNQKNPVDTFKIGDKLEAKILTINFEERKMSLTIKQLLNDPWSEIETKYPINSKHKGKVTNFKNFGVFVELEKGIEGFVYLSDLSWMKKIKHPSDILKLGQEIDVVIMNIDKENRKINLSHKHSEEDPWTALESTFTVGTKHKCLVSVVLPKGAIILLPYGLEGFAPTKHLIKEDGSILKVDQEAEFEIIEFNKDSKRIIVSHSQTYKKEAEKISDEETNKKNQSEKNNEKNENIEKKESNNKSKKTTLNKASGKTTLGDLNAFTDAVSDIKNNKTENETKQKTKAAKKKEEAEASNESINEETSEKKVAKKTTKKTTKDAETKSETNVVKEAKVNKVAKENKEVKTTDENKESEPKPKKSNSKK